MNTRLCLAAAVLILAACDRPGPGGEPRDVAGASASGFAHNQTEDLSGYYRPQSEVIVRAYRLDSVFIGQSPDFAAWEGGRRSDGFAPIMLEFTDLRPPADGTQTVTLRVLPDAYAVSDRSVRLSATHPDLGAVRLEGVLDTGGLAEARRNLGGAEAPALVADLTLDGRTFENVAFGWSMGD